MEFSTPLVRNLLLIFFCHAHEDDSDTEGTSPSLAKRSTSAGSSRGAGGGKKTERNFWQYNVQAKGPKGQKIVIETKIEDPHVLNDIVDPVFSGDVQLQVCSIRNHRFSVK